MANTHFMEDGKNTAVRLPGHLDRALSAEAKRRMTTRSTIIRQAIARELGLMERRQQQEGEGTRP